MSTVPLFAKRHPLITFFVLIVSSRGCSGRYVRSCADLVRQKPFASVEYCEADRAFTLGRWQKLYASARPGYGVLVHDTRHTNFIDWALPPLRPWSPAKRSLGKIEGRLMRRVTSDYLLAFFDRHLNDASVPLFDGPSPDHPEVVLGAPDVLFERTNRQGELTEFSTTASIS